MHFTLHNLKHKSTHHQLILEEQIFKYAGTYFKCSSIRLSKQEHSLETDLYVQQDGNEP